MVTKSDGFRGMVCFLHDTVAYVTKRTFWEKYNSEIASFFDFCPQWRPKGEYNSKNSFSPK